jgi:hypothetical protein
MTSDGDSNELESEFLALRGKLVDHTAKLEPDIAATLFLREKAQADLQVLLEKLGVTKRGIMESKETNEHEQK